MNNKLLEYIIRAQSCLLQGKLSDCKMFLEESRNILEQ